jgi:hypothetical protein
MGNTMTAWSIVFKLMNKIKNNNGPLKALKNGENPARVRTSYEDAKVLDRN